MNYCVITTINKPTAAIEKLYKHFGENIIVIGDYKTPNDWAYKGARFFSIESESGIDFSLSAPLNHYARKNIGYLIAIKNGAKVIFDTDDDNCPNENFHIRTESTEACEAADEGWLNVYEAVSSFPFHPIWPRGFPLNQIIKKNQLFSYSIKAKHEKIISPIQQGLADGDPDVDAIWRLTLQEEHYCFEEKISILLNRNTWCPFNSQSTWWFPVAYPLMYLPVYATFRMTDIWRSFVAQRCLWELDMGVTFHSPAEVYQYRNEHDLMADFKDEIDGYLKNELIVETLQNLELKKGQENICMNMLTCYEAMIGIGVLPQKELMPLLQWIKDYEKFK